ncbi:MAG: heavy metal-associated domain-containing protein [Flavobacteriaceae bacterium]
MKTSKTLLMLAFSGLFLMSCKETPTDAAVENTTETEQMAENIQTANFSIEGMHCEFGCAKTIEKKLAGLEGVKSASVDFESKKATVEYNAATQTPQVLAQSVEAMADGKTYTVSEVKSSSDQSSLFQEQPKKVKKSKEAKKTKKQQDSQSKELKTTEGKKGCCSGKSSCSSKA